MKTARLLLGLCILAIVSSAVPALANDGPHNNASNMSCSSCHDSAIMNSPFWNAGADNTAYNNLCMLRCHNAATGPYTDTSAPLAITHSSDTTSEQYGTWDYSCKDCHDPHYQAQKNYRKSYPSAIYLASGTISMPAPAYDSNSNTTVLSYSALTYKGDWNAAKLVNKSGTGRHAILIPNLKKVGFAYPILRVDDPDANTITVKGDATEAYTYVNPPTSFGVLYGQMLKQLITVNGTAKQVVLFDREGPYSLAYDESNDGTDPTPNGICQVCHVNTSQWNADGSGAATGLHANFNGQACAFCHFHSNGFAPVDADHSPAGYNSVLPFANCVSCHAGPDHVTDTHAQNCSHCHEAGASGLTLQAGLAAGACSGCHSAYSSDFAAGHQNEDHDTLATTSSATPTLNCAGCHTGDIIDSADIHNSQCNDCHTNSITNGTFTSVATGHSIGATSTCASCHGAGYFPSHTHTHSVIIQGGDVSQEMTTACSACHNDAGNSLATWAAIYQEHGSDCTVCHNATRDVCPDAGKCATGSGTIQTVIAANANPTACAACHKDKVDSSSSDATHGIDHLADGKVTGSGTTCVACHDQAGVNSNSQYIATIHGTCNKCHVATYGGGPLRDYSGSGGTIGQNVNYEAINGGAGGSCVICHAAFATDFAGSHQNETHGELSGSANCTSCHTTAIATVLHTACSTCHTNTATDGRLKAAANGTAAGHTVGGSSTCADCHAAYNTSFVNGHQNEDHSGIIANQNPVGYRDDCVDCHTGNLISSARVGNDPGTHQNDCLKCHTNTTSNGSLRDGANNFGDARGHVLGTPSDCDSCHAADGFFDSHVYVKSVEQEAVDVSWGIGAPCSACHNDNGNNLATWDDIHFEHGPGCAICHETNRDTSKSGTYSIGKTIQTIIKANADPTGCIDCHRDKIDSIAADPTHGVNHKGDGKVTGSGTTCVGCHDQAGNDSNGQYLVTIHQACNTCHVAQYGGGPLRDYSGTGGTIGQFVNYETINAGHGGSCLTCHAAYATDFQGAHQNPDHRNAADSADVITGDAKCTSCHSGATAANIIDVTHDLQSDCTNCHTNMTTDGRLKVGANGRGTALLHIINSASSCVSCHAVYGTNFSIHAVADHSGIIANQAPANARANCVTCHTGNLITAVLSGTNPGTHQNTCTKCHTNTSTDGSLTDGANNYGDARGHSITAASDCNACHSGDGYFDTHTHNVGHTVSIAASDDSMEQGYACSMCHNDAGNSLATWASILTEHANACATCHDATRNVCADAGKCVVGGTTIQTVIAANSATNCSACHVAKVDSTSSNAVHGYADHTTNPAGGLAYAPITVNAECLACHDPAGTLDVVLDIHGGQCARCHIAMPTLKGTPNLAQFAGSTTACIDCHATANDTGFTTPFHGVSWAHSATQTRHNNLGGSNSTGGYDCAACHTTMTTASAKLSKHMGTDTPANCLRCHYPNTYGGLSDTPAQTVIAAGSSGGGNVAQNCESCHTGKGVYRRHGMTGNNGADGVVDIHDQLSTSGIVAPTDCANCHAMTSVLARLQLHMAPVSGDVNDCLTCHNAVGNAVTAISNGKGGAAQTCISCHAGKGDYTLHGLTEAAVADVHDKLSGSNAGASEANCGNCHTSVTAENRIDLHANCLYCHAPGNTTYVSPTPSTSGTAAATIVSNGRTHGGNAIQYCESCHSAANNYSLHGLTSATVSGAHTLYSGSNAGASEANCTNCHLSTTAENRINLHAACSTCHTTHASDGTGRTTVINAGREAGHHVGGGGATAQYCESCHTGQDVYSLHGLTDNTIGHKHENFETTNYTGENACYYCHITTSYQNRVDLHPACSTCHGLHEVLSDIRTTTINLGRETGHKVGGGGNTVVRCESCHTQKGQYRMHGLTDDDGPDGVADRHDNFGNSLGYTASFTSASMILTDPGYNCADCHLMATAAQRLQLHTYKNGYGRGDCLTCHASDNIKDEILSAREAGHHIGGGGGTELHCETCHSIENGNGPSGAKMYQYDGERHHATVNAQAGNCTYCHGDPRPSPIAAGWAGTSVNNVGWQTEYSKTGPQQKQLACRLCHSNYESMSFNVYGGNGNHGYNIGGLSHGLTIYKNEFDAEPVASFPSGNTNINTVATPLIQSQIHRIEANNGSSKINVYNYGACFSCHSMQLFHAFPEAGVDYPTPIKSGTDYQYTQPFDTLRYAPGRGVFNEFQSQHRKPQKWLENTTYESRGKSLFKNQDSTSDNPGFEFGSAKAHNSMGASMALLAAVNNAEGLIATYGLNKDITPVFTDIAAPPVADGISIGWAEWNGTTVTLWAINDKTNTGGVTLRFNYPENGSICSNVAMSWANNRWNGTCNTASFTPGNTVKVTSTYANGGFNTRTVLNSSYVLPNAVNDNFNILPNATTAVLPMQNDTGSELYIDTTDETNLNANCSTLVNLENVEITCGNGWTGNTSFTYTLKDRQGDSSTATVNLTVAWDIAPTLSISQPDGVADSIVAGDSFNITYTLTDPDDAVTAAFYYDTNNSGADGTAITGACATAVEGAGATCAWNTAGLQAGTYYIYGVTSDGVNPAVTTYSAGPVTVSSAVAVVTPWTLLTTSGQGTNTISATHSAAAGTDRIMLVSVSWETSSGAADSNETLSGTYGSQSITQVNRGVSSNGRQGVWVGYLTEAKIAGRGASNTISLSFDGDGLIPNRQPTIAVTIFEDASQGAPTSVANAGTSNTINFGANLSVVNKGYVTYFISANNATAFTPASGYTERLDLSNANFRMTAADKLVTANGTENHTITHTGSVTRWGLVAVAISPH